MIMKKYTIKKYQVIFQNGNRDKVNLEIPIHTNDIEAARAKLMAKHTGLGLKCVGLNMDYDEYNKNEL